MQCPRCGAENPEVLARHDYSIEYEETLRRWVKTEGGVTYSCGNCLAILETNEITDILKQVDEL